MGLVTYLQSKRELIFPETARHTLFLHLFFTQPNYINFVLLFKTPGCTCPVP